MLELSGKRRVWFISLAVAVILMAVVIALACGRTEVPPRSLVVMSGARGVVYSSYGGTEQVRYELTEKYPAKHTLKQISDELAEQGFKPLRDDFQNPGHPSSHVTGWNFFTDRTRNRNEAVRRWIAQWSNSSGDVVDYNLEYRWPGPSAGAPIGPGGLFAPTTDRLQVYGIYMPAKLAKPSNAP
jgi:hypothetical protein